MAKKTQSSVKEPEHDRIVLLNTMLSLSTTRAPGHTPPTLGAMESFRLLDARRKKGWAGLDEKPLGKFADSEKTKTNGKQLGLSLVWGMILSG
jgi:hypothetical protein